jgi:hypothetical protein
MSLESAPSTPIQLCAGLPDGGVAAVFSDGSIGEYEASARNRRVAETKNRNPTSSFRRLLEVGVNSREIDFIEASSRGHDYLARKSRAVPRSGDTRAGRL